MPTEDISMTMNVLPGTFAGLTAAAAGMNQIVGLVNTLGNRVGQTTTILDSMLVTLSAGITYAGFEASKAAGEFERSMKMVKVVSGQSAAEIDVLSRKANELSIQFKMGIEDITDGLQTLGRAGLGSLDTQISVLETGLSAAKLSGLELSKVLQDIVQTTSLLGGDITSVSFGRQADALTNKILATSMTAPINMNDIVQTLSYSGGTAAAAGINIENEDALYDYLGTVSAFARKGVSGSMAGTALRAFFTKPASQDESVKGAFETLGLQAEDLWKNNGQEMRKVSEQIQIIHDAMNKRHMSTLDQIEIWGKIVGNKMGQQMMKLDEGNIREVTQEIQESENATKLANESMQNFASDLATLQQQGAAMWREFGNSALTVFRPIISGLKVIAGLLSPTSTSGTIFGQLLAGGIIIVISQVIARLGTAWRLIRNITSELRRQINDHSQTTKQIDVQRAKQMEVYKAMGLSDKQAERLAKDASNTGFNIQFMNKAMTEFLAKLNEVVAMMTALVSQTEILARAPLQNAVAGQYTRLYTALNSKQGGLSKVNFNSMVPLPAWLDKDSKDWQGGLFGYKGTTPYLSNMSQFADAHHLPQEFLTQLYRGEVSEEYMKKFGISSSDAFTQWLKKHPSMIHTTKKLTDTQAKAAGIEEGTKAKAAIIPLSSLDSFLKESGLGKYKTETSPQNVNINNPKAVTWTGENLSQNPRYYGQNTVPSSTPSSLAGAKQTAVIEPKTQPDQSITPMSLEEKKEYLKDYAIKQFGKGITGDELQESITKKKKELGLTKEDSQEIVNAHKKTTEEISSDIKKASDTFTKKYGMTPEQYDANVKQMRSLTQLQNIQESQDTVTATRNKLLRIKGGHAKWLSEYEAQLNDVQNLMRTRKEYGQTFYDESKTQNAALGRKLERAGLSNWTDSYIKDMRRLEQVSQQVSQSKNLQFTKAGYITADTATTQYAKDYNELRKKYSTAGGPLDKNMEAKEIQKVAASQNALIKENSKLITQYKVNEEYMKNFDAEMKNLSIREQELNAKITEQKKNIDTLDTSIQNANRALKEFSAILLNPQNQKVLNNSNNPAIVRAHHDTLNSLNSEQMKNDKEALDETKKALESEKKKSPSSTVAAYQNYANQYAAEKEKELEALNKMRTRDDTQRGLTGGKVFGPAEPNAYQKQLSDIAKQEEENLKLREKYMPQYGHLAGRGAGTTANPDEWDKYTTRTALKNSNINADGNRVFNQGGFLSRLRASWNQETSKTSRYYGDAMRNTGFGSSLKNSLSKHILNPISQTQFGQGFRTALLKHLDPNKWTRERQNTLVGQAQNLPKEYQVGTGIPPQFLSRGYMGGPIKADTTGFKQWATQGGMLRFFDIKEFRQSLTTAGRQWAAGGKRAAIGTALGGALGSISMLFGPIEALTMAISVGKMVYQKTLEEYNKKLTEQQSALSEAIDKYEKVEESYSKSYKKNKDEIVASQEKVAAAWKKQNPNRNFGTTTDTSAKAAKGTQFVGGSRQVENALITIAKARESGTIDQLDDNTMKMHEELLKVRANTDKLADIQAGSVHGPTGLFSKLKYEFGLEFTNRKDWNDDMSMIMGSLSDYKDAAQMLGSYWTEKDEPDYHGGLVENELEGRKNTDFWTDGNNVNETLDMLHDSIKNRFNNAQNTDVYKQYLKEGIGAQSEKDINKMMIALNKNEKDFKYLGKLMLHETANSGRINNYIRGLGVKTGLTAIQIRQAAMIQAMTDMKNIAENSILPAMKDTALAGYQTAASVGIGNQIGGGSLQTENAIYSAANAIATNVAVLVDNAITEQAEKDTEGKRGFMNLLGVDEATRVAAGGGNWWENLFGMGMDKQAVLKAQHDKLVGMAMAANPTWSEHDAEVWIQNRQNEMLKKQGVTRSDIQYKAIEDTLLKGISGKAYRDILDQYENSSSDSDNDSGKGKGSGSDKDKDKDKSSKKNWVNLAICNKKEIPKLNVNLFKKPPNFTILNRNFKLRDVNVNTADDAKSIQNAVKNSIIEIQNRSNPKIIQDDAAEYDPVNATEGNQLPTGTKKTE